MSEFKQYAMNAPIEKKRFSPRRPRAAVPRHDGIHDGTSYSKAYPGETEVVKLTLHKRHAALLRRLAASRGGVHIDDCAALLVLGAECMPKEFWLEADRRFLAFALKDG